MTKKDYSYTEHYSYTSKDADYQSLVKPSAIINYFIQIAWMHAENLGMGYSHLMQERKSWVLSKFTLKLDKTPNWPGKLSIKTWPKGHERLFYIRDAELMDEENKIFGAITSSWLVIDIDSKRPKLLENISEELYTKTDAIAETTPTLKITGSEDYSMDYVVRYNDIDVNHHLTTVRYLELMFDTFDLEFIQANTLKELSVNFVKEIKFGTPLRVKRFKQEDNFLFEISHQESGFAFFKGQLVF